MYNFRLKCVVLDNLRLVFRLAQFYANLFSPEQAEVHHLVEGAGLLLADRTTADAGAGGRVGCHPPSPHCRLGILLWYPEQGAPVAMRVPPGGNGNCRIRSGGSLVMT